MSRKKQPPQKSTIELVLSRVEELLRDIRNESNHGKISIEVVAGRYYVDGGPRIEYKNHS